MHVKRKEIQIQQENFEKMDENITFYDIMPWKKEFI
jgi:hypothetical protein